MGKQGNKENKKKQRESLQIQHVGRKMLENQWKTKETNGKQQKHEGNEGKPMRKQWKPMENKEKVRKCMENQ